MSRKKTKKGFTLVELVVVIAVIGILAGVSVATYFGVVESANKSTDEQLCKQYNDLLAMERVNDSDITLPELISLIESNGLNANDFKTNSKSYTFAYDKANTTTVLLNSDGNVAFPKNYKVSSDGLWAAIKGGEQLVLSAHIPNYALLGGSIYLSGANSILGDNDNIRIDLNGNSLSTSKEFKLENKNITLENGYYIYSSGTDAHIGNKLSNISVDKSKGGEERDLNANENVQVSTDSSGSKLNVSATETGKSYFSTYVKKDGNNENSITKNVTNDNETVYTYTNCVFSGISFKIETSKATKVVFDNCKFTSVPIGNYPLVVNTPNADVTIKNCTFDNVVRGINSLVLNEGKVFTLENNTFNLTTKLTAKVEDKSNALQISYAVGCGNNGTVGKWVINNNTITRGKALLTIHSNLGTKNSFNAVKDKFTSDKFALNGNNLDGAKGIVSIDPGYMTDSLKDSGLDTREEWRSNLIALAKAIDTNVIE